MTAVKIVLSTAPSPEVASTLARTLVEEHLAACVNIVPGVRSIYRWQGAVEESQEVLLVVKCAEHGIAALEKRLTELHPYELPEFVVISPDAMSAAYERWVMDSTSRR